MISRKASLSLLVALTAVIAFYALAKLLETFDKSVFATLQFVSGHTLKHLAAAAAGYCILRMVQKREPLTSQVPRT